MAKEKLGYYDRNAKKRDIEEGSLVLVRTLDLQGQLEDVWEGPYEVQKKIGDVTYTKLQYQVNDQHPMTGSETLPAYLDSYIIND